MAPAVRTVVAERTPKLVGLRLASKAVSGNMTKVLLLFIIVVACCTLLVHQRFFLPVGSSAAADIKHARAERAQLREQFYARKLLPGRDVQDNITSAAGSLLADAADMLRSRTSQVLQRVAAHTNTQPSLVDNADPASMVQEEAVAEQDKWSERRDVIRDAFVFSWQAYEQYAWGNDELVPLSMTGRDNFGGMGATLIDNLDTLWLMGLRQQFNRARDWVAHGLELYKDQYRQVSLFETAIRILGGLLAAYDWSQDKVFLDRAKEVGELLAPSFRENEPVGIPSNTVLLRDPMLGSEANPFHSYSASLAEFALEVEFMTLSHRSNNTEYADHMERIFRWLEREHPNQGLLPTMVATATGQSMSETFTMGAMADSHYEYLLKTWLLKRKQDDMWRAFWERAIDDAISMLVRQSCCTYNLTFVGDSQSGMIQERMEHLTCFLPGNIALGVMQGAVQGKKAEAYLQLAKDLTYTCWQMNELMPTGLAPEVLAFLPDSEITPGGWSNAHVENKLRPEVVESMFYLWRATGDVKYREWGWRLYEAFERYCKVEAGFSGIQDVRAVPPVHNDVMESFWLSETLKYLYLLFSPNDVVPLDEWVLNTEAHPVRLLPLEWAVNSSRADNYPLPPPLPPEQKMGLMNHNYQLHNPVLDASFGNNLGGDDPNEQTGGILMNPAVQQAALWAQGNRMPVLVRKRKRVRHDVFGGLNLSRRGPRPGSFPLRGRVFEGLVQQQSDDSSGGQLAGAGADSSSRKAARGFIDDGTGSGTGTEIGSRPLVEELAGAGGPFSELRHAYDQYRGGGADGIGASLAGDFAEPGAAHDPGAILNGVASGGGAETSGGGAEASGVAARSDGSLGSGERQGSAAQQRQQQQQQGRRKPARPRGGGAGVADRSRQRGGADAEAVGFGGSLQLAPDPDDPAPDPVGPAGDPSRVGGSLQDADRVAASRFEEEQVGRANGVMVDLRPAVETD